MTQLVTTEHQGVGFVVTVNIYFALFSMMFHSFFGWTGRTLRALQEKA